MPSSDSSATQKIADQIPSTEQLKEKIPSAEQLKEDVAKTAKKSLSSLRDFVAGGVGGVCSVVVGHPFDLIKVRLQTAEKGVYSGAMDVMRKTIAREGPVRVSNSCENPMATSLSVMFRGCTLVFLRPWLA